MALDEVEAHLAATETATFALGAFWGAERGVVSVAAGVTDETVFRYRRGVIDTATNTTGHAEAVEITYDPQQISYAELLRTFWGGPRCHRNRSARPGARRAPVSVGDLLPDVWARGLAVSDGHLILDVHGPAMRTSWPLSRRPGLSVNGDAAHLVTRSSTARWDGSDWRLTQ